MCGCPCSLIWREWNTFGVVTIAWLVPCGSPEKHCNTSECKPYLVGLLAMLKCNICFYQCGNCYVSNWRFACRLIFSGETACWACPEHLACCIGMAHCYGTQIKGNITSNSLPMCMVFFRNTEIRAAIWTYMNNTHACCPCVGKEIHKNMQRHSECLL